MVSALEAEHRIDEAKLGRMHALITRLVDELRSADLDPASLDRLERITYQTLVEIGSAVSDELVAELGRLAAPVTGAHPSACELRVLGAQLMGWRNGIAVAETHDDRAARAS